MELGIVGKPNVGKSTFFSAATRLDVEVASYPFTTIDANIGVGYIRNKCPHEELGVECEPNNAPCIEGTRMIPIKMIDVAGLVPGAHTGKGLGNKFLDDLRQASALIHIVDTSGSTDIEGEPCNIGEHDPREDIEFLTSEIDHWLKGIIDKNWEKVSRKLELVGGKVERVIHEQLSGLGVTEPMIVAALRGADLPDNPKSWSQDDILDLARAIRKKSKPMLIAANKIDIAPKGSLDTLISLKEHIVIPTLADYELALRKASENGIVDYHPGEVSFSVLKDDINKAQRAALEKISEHMEEHGGLGIQQTLEKAIYELLDLIVVYPVENEHSYTDKEGRILPDAHLLPRGSTAEDLAFAVHTDIGKGFIRAIDSRIDRVIGRDHVLKDGDVIKIVSKK